MDNRWNEKNCLKLPRKRMVSLNKPNPHKDGHSNSHLGRFEMQGNHHLNQNEAKTKKSCNRHLFNYPRKYP